MRTMTPEQIYARRWVTLGVLCLSLLLIVVDNSIVNVALPTLVRDLHASTAALQWVPTPTRWPWPGCCSASGSLGDRIGRHQTLAGGLVVFGVGSALAAMSAPSVELIACRVVMGIGAAAIMPATLSILTNVFTVPGRAGQGHRHLVGRLGPGRGDRPDARRLAARALQLGLHLPGQPADRRRSR